MHGVYCITAKKMFLSEKSDCYSAVSEGKKHHSRNYLYYRFKKKLHICINVYV